MKALVPTLILMAMVLLVGSVELMRGTRAIKEGYASSTWPQAEGTVLESNLANSGSSREVNSRKISYHPVILYGYTVEGRYYQNSKIDSFWAWTYSSSRRMVEANPVGSHRPVYYCPSLPGSSVLLKGLHPHSFFDFLVGTLFLSAGILFGTVDYLAPRYGQWNGAAYLFDNHSPVARIAVVGISALVGQAGLLFWICY